jgi:hypothetical protein
VTTDQQRRVAQIAYEAYVTAAGGKSLVSGDPLPQWAALPLIIQQAWIAASAAVQTAVAAASAGLRHL